VPKVGMFRHSVEFTMLLVSYGRLVYSAGCLFHCPVYFLGPRNCLKCGPLHPLGPQLLHYGPWQSYRKYTDCFLQSTPKWSKAYLHCRQCGNCSIAARNRSLNGMVNFIHVWGTLEHAFRFNLTCLRAPES